MGTVRKKHMRYSRFERVRHSRTMKLFLKTQAARLSLTEEIVFELMRVTSAEHVRALSTEFEPIVIDDPSNVSVKAGAAASFEALAVGNPEPTVKWQKQTKGAGAWSDISGATNVKYTIASTTVGMSTDKFRAVFTNSQGSATTAAATLTVTA